MVVCQTEQAYLLLVLHDRPRLLCLPLPGSSIEELLKAIHSAKTRLSRGSDSESEIYLLVMGSSLTPKLGAHPYNLSLPYDFE